MGTEIVVIVKRDRVILASDSVQSGSDGSHNLACKIHQNGHYFWAAGGNVKDTGTGFNIEKFFTSKNANMGVREALDSLDTSLTPVLQGRIPRLKQTDDEFYRKMVREGIALSIFAVGSSGPEVVGLSKDFLFIKGRVVPIPAKTCSPIQCLITVNGNDVAEYITANQYLWGKGISDLVEALMTHARTVDPQGIGPPYAILEVDTNGAYWINRTSCAEVTRPGEPEPKAKPKGKAAKSK